MFSLTSDCQRNAFRISPNMDLKVKVFDELIPIIDISINGISFHSDNLNEGDTETVTIQLADNMPITAQIEVIHLSSVFISPICGCQFKNIKDNDRDFINHFILQQQKKQIKIKQINS